MSYFPLGMKRTDETILQLLHDKNSQIMMLNVNVMQDNGYFKI